MPTQPSNQPTEATAERGEVLLDGPHGLAVSLTPEAASRSAEAIARAAREARAYLAGADAGRAGGSACAGLTARRNGALTLPGG